MDAVLQAEHASQHPIEPRAVRGEGDEVEAGLGDRAVGHAAAVDRPLLAGVVGDLNAGDVRVRRLLVVGELAAGRPGAPHRPLLVGYRKAREGVQVVDPAHDEHVAATGARLALGDQRHLWSLVRHRVGGAVDEADEVPRVAMNEGRLVGRQHGHVRERLDGGAGVLEHDVPRAAADPQPEVVLGRGARWPPTALMGVKG